jgi:hypothetical protein
MLARPIEQDALSGRLGRDNHLPFHTLCDPPIKFRTVSTLTSRIESSSKETRGRSPDLNPIDSLAFFGITIWNFDESLTICRALQAYASTAATPEQDCSASEGPG